MPGETAAGIGELLVLKLIVISLLILLIIICGLGVFTITSNLPTEITPSTSEEQGTEVAGTGTPPQEATVQPEPTPTPGPTPTPEVFLSGLSTGPLVIVGEDGLTYQVSGENEPPRRTRALPRHGIIIAFILPLFVIGVPWLISEIFTIRYVQPRGEDVTNVLIKAKDGLFVHAVVSMTARRNLTLASSRMTWPRVRSFVEKTIEQEIIHEAIQFQSLEELEQNIKVITEKLLTLPIIEELSINFGVEVLRFNIEIRYTPETMDALQRKAEASAGGTAYLAYAAAAHLDPDRPESRELYRIYQETSSQVDAARSLGGGITRLITSLRWNDKDQDNDESNRE